MLLPIFTNSYYPATVVLAVFITHCVFFYLIVVLLEIISYVIQVLTQNSNIIIGVPLVREDPSTTSSLWPGRHGNQY